MDRKCMFFYFCFQKQLTYFIFSPQNQPEEDNWQPASKECTQKIKDILYSQLFMWKFLQVKNSVTMDAWLKIWFWLAISTCKW